MRRMNKRLSSGVTDAEAAEHNKRIKEIEAALLREAMLANEKVRQSAISSMADGADAAMAAASGNNWRTSAQSVLRASALRDGPRTSTYSAIFGSDDR